MTGWVFIILIKRIFPNTEPAQCCHLWMSAGYGLKVNASRQRAAKKEAMTMSVVKIVAIQSSWELIDASEQSTREGGHSLDTPQHFR